MLDDVLNTSKFKDLIGLFRLILSLGNSQQTKKCDCSVICGNVVVTTAGEMLGGMGIGQFPSRNPSVATT